MREKNFLMTAAFYSVPNGWSVLVSSGPHANTNDALRKLGAEIFVQDGRPHGAERRRLAEMALQMGAEYALWTEEKPYLIKHLPVAIERMEEKGANALIFNRTEESWPSWPTIQQKSERLCNDFYNTLFGVDGETFDPMLGPALFNQSGLENYAVCDPTEYGVDDIYPNLIAPLAIKANGDYVTSLTVNLMYPPKQRVEEEEDPGMMLKRMRQVAYVTTAWSQSV